MNKTSDMTLCFQVNGNEIDIVHETKYLGVMIDEKLKWSNQIKFLQKKMSQVLVLLKYIKQFVHEITLKNHVYKHRWAQLELLLLSLGVL